MSDHPMNSYANYIGGADVAAADGRTFTAFNPTTGDVWGTFALAGQPEGNLAADPAPGPRSGDRHDRRSGGREPALRFGRSRCGS